MTGKTEQYKCQSYYDEGNVLQDCTCGKCGSIKPTMTGKGKCQWCLKEPILNPTWEQQNTKGIWEPLGKNCTKKRLNNPYNGLLSIRKISPTPPIPDEGEKRIVDYLFSTNLRWSEIHCRIKSRIPITLDMAEEYEGAIEKLQSLFTQKEQEVRKEEREGFEAVALRLQELRKEV